MNNENNTTERFQPQHLANNYMMLRMLEESMKMWVEQNFNPEDEDEDEDFFTQQLKIINEMLTPNTLLYMAKYPNDYSVTVIDRLKNAFFGYTRSSSQLSNEEWADKLYYLTKAAEASVLIDPLLSKEIEVAIAFAAIPENRVNKRMWQCNNRH